MTEDLQVSVSSGTGKTSRLVTIQNGEVRYRDTTNLNSAKGRRQVIRGAAEKFGVEEAELKWLDDELVERAEEFEAASTATPTPVNGCKSHATQIVELVVGAEFFHDSSGEAYARFREEGHLQVAALHSAAFRHWLGGEFYRATGRAASKAAINAALEVFKAKALYSGPERSVHLRIAKQDDKIYVDMCNEAWQVIEITTNGWHVLDNSPVMFRRTKGMLALPLPETGGQLSDLRPLINVVDRDWPLVAAWLVMALNPAGPFPLLAVHGEHGSAKTTFCQMVRLLIDPHGSLLRSKVRRSQQLITAAHNGWVLALDNLSEMNAEISDTLCRISTGGGFATQSQDSDGEETFFDAQRPALINGIDELVNRSDLLDRCLLITLPVIPDGARRTEDDIWGAFREVHPRLLGALFTAASQALRELPHTRLECLPRMADFALWVTAAEPALGLAAGEFMRTYQENRSGADRFIIDADPVGVLLETFLEEASGIWSGTATALLEALRSRVDDVTRRQRAWPKDARALSTVLRRLAPNLRRLGIEVDFDRIGPKGERIILLTPVEQGRDFASDASVPSGEELIPAVSEAKDAESDAENEAADAADATDANYQLDFTWGASQTDLFLGRLGEDCILGGGHEEFLMWFIPQPNLGAAFKLIGSIGPENRPIDSRLPWDSIRSADFSTALN